MFVSIYKFVPFFDLEVSDQIQIISIIATTIISIVSVWIAVATLKQTNRITEEANRPYITVYGATTNFQSPKFMIVVKNFGQSGALIKEFSSDYDLLSCVPGNPNNSHRPFENLKNTFIVPNQSFVSVINYLKVIEDNVENINFKIIYQTGKKVYNETVILNLATYKGLFTQRASTDGKELRTISYTLQDLVEKIYNFNSNFVFLRVSITFSRINLYVSNV